MSEKKSHKPSKADIAKQFVLPERQSKITTLLNQAGQAYCICRTSDSSRFMIGCDACEEWYHGDCINITEREARYIRQYYCERCRQEDPSLTTRFKPRKRERDDRDRDERKKKRKEHSENRIQQISDSSPEERVSASASTCGTCSGCTRVYDCARCDACQDNIKNGITTKLKLKCKQRTCVNKAILSHKKSSSSPSNRSKHPPTEVATVATNNGPDNTTVFLPHLLSTTRQCYGPKCTKAALIGSKYCSDSCGMRLATSRIYQVLPQRIQEWSLRSCGAEGADRKALARVRSQIACVHAALQQLERKRLNLDELIERAKLAQPASPKDEDSEEETEMSIYCITCGHEIHSRTAVKHMEKCFIKYEAQSSFGSVFKTRIEGNNMFCDFYNPSNQTYCKRLRVLCPEHCKEPKINDTDVCGCPLVKDLFIPSGEFCRAPRKSCLKHHAWEKLRRAEVDMERVRQWLKIDELMEQERNIRCAMASRAGVLGLMLHSTYNHEVMEMITSNIQSVKQ
ncbi:CXXC-type zinc finger protein 1-like isoform X2 [Arctopsyche grandis]|uniref:CXXC-type zinc finger protein 1-like isoform X2 n=1 Tax=Arctopsyche grandis TaxID=121162 RepID=UPI00406D99B7